jgi:hypothetical protein
LNIIFNDIMRGAFLMIIKFLLLTMFPRWVAAHYQAVTGTLRCCYLLVTLVGPVACSKAADKKLAMIY